MKLARCALLLAAGFLGACAAAPSGSSPAAPAEAPATARTGQLLFLNRVTWGADSASERELAALGRERWLERQLDPNAPDALPPEAQREAAAMTVSDFLEKRKALQAGKDPGDRKAFQQEVQRVARGAMARSLLRALYSPQQLRSQMTWFWMNHFNVFVGKGPLRVMVGDYEESVIRPHALGRFRELLGAVARSPAMLVYLDNARNRFGAINENYARELMELHTLGVDAGYTQQDVQELARVLTGYGIDRDGRYAFHPRLHDRGDKLLLGRTLRGGGEEELDAALDLLARAPQTARFVSRKLALFFVSDDPPPALVARMARRFQETDGDIAQVLRFLFSTEEFQESLGTKFKDPIHYVVSAVRLAYDGKVIVNPAPMLAWLARMGEPLYGRQTPDGYSLVKREWASAGQLETRFEIARNLGFGAPGLWKAEGADAMARPGFPQLSNALYYESMQSALGRATKASLEQAGSPQEWNQLLLSSPEFMNR